MVIGEWFHTETENLQFQNRNHLVYRISLLGDDFQSHILKTGQRMMDICSLFIINFQLNRINVIKGSVTVRYIFVYCLLLSLFAKNL